MERTNARNALKITNYIRLIIFLLIVYQSALMELIIIIMTNVYNVILLVNSVKMISNALNVLRMQI
jgi:hypothetical protein